MEDTHELQRTYCTRDLNYVGSFTGATLSL
jgi:hypothetical protein